MTGGTALDVLARLATPLWLVSADGAVVWCNEAARVRLGVAAEPAAASLSVRWDGEVAPALAELAPGQRLAASLAFRTTAPSGKKVRARCELSRTDGSLGVAGAAFLAEAVTVDSRPCDLIAEALENLPIGVALFDGRNRLVSSNRRYRDLCDGDEDLAPGRLIGPLTSSRLTAPPQDRRTADGRSLRFFGVPLPGGGVVLACTDVTDLRACQDVRTGAGTSAEADGLGAMALIQHLSHELRTPLNAVIGFSEIIADDLMPSSGAQRYQDYAGEIRNAAAYMLELINNLLDLARLEAGQVDLDEEPCDLVRLITLTVRMVTPRARAAGVPVAVVLKEPPPLILGDAMLIRQMLTNLIVNAIKFSAPVAGRVEIRTERDDGGGLAVVVRDSGIGMRADQIPLALHPFRQVHSAATVPDKRSGLGLPLTNALITRHGGRMTIASAPGAGTVVRLVFPSERLCCSPAAEPRAQLKAMLRPLS